MSKMLYIKISFILLILLFLGGNFVAAQNEEDDSSGSSSMEDIEKQIEDSEKLLKELREEADEQQRNLQDTQEYAGTLQQQVGNFESQISSLRAKINVKEQEITTRNLQIDRINLEIEEKEGDIDTSKTQMAALFQEIYKNDEEGLVELLFKYKNFSDFFGQVQSRSSLNESVKIKLEDLKQLKQELESGKEQLEESKAELQEEQSGLTAQRAILDQSRVNQQELLNQTRDQEGEYQRILSEIRAQEQAMRREIFDLEEQLRRTLDPSSVPTPFEGLLAWPSEGVITQGYGCIHTSWARNSYPSCDGGGGGFHNGVDVAAGLGSPIRAADEGRVIAMASSPYTYGYWVAVEHTNGLVTLYTHMSSMRPVGLGQEVSRGQLVGYMDSTGFSTGPHIHFTVYAPGTFTTKPSTIAGILPIGATLNPFDYLR